MRPHPPEVRAEALRLAASGLAHRAVAARVGVSQPTVSKWVRAARAESGEPSPQDWGAWSEWQDEREPDRDSVGWREWFDERFGQEMQAMNRCCPDGWERMPQVLLRVDCARLGLDGTWEALHDWCLRESRGQAVWADARGQVGHMVDEDAVVLRVQVDAQCEESYRAAALGEAERARAAGFEVPGFAQDLVDLRGIEARGGRSVNTLRQHAKRWRAARGFPAPLVEAGFVLRREGMTPGLWAWGDVLAWERAHATGEVARRIARCGRAPSSAEVDWLNALLALGAHDEHTDERRGQGAMVG